MMHLKRHLRPVTAIPRTILLLAGMLIGSTAGAGQGPAVPGSQAAENGYHEMTAKNYQAAIQAFKKALAEDPSNSRWRKDLGYADVAAGLFEDADKQFEMVYREHSDDLEIALELGYVSQQLHREDAAEGYFQAATRSADDKISTPARAALANLRASQLQTRKQKAYGLLAQDRRAEAITWFERVHEADPSDGTTTLQLGYLYHATGDLAKAREMFQAERDNQNPKIAYQATAALAEVNRGSMWWFGSVYAAPFYESRFSNEINPFNAKIGLRASPYLQPYIGLRFTRDTRSRSGTLPEIFSDNSAVFSFGVQSAILGHGANLYAEAGTAVSLTGRQRHAVPDYRVGLNWFQQWGVTLAEASQNSQRGVHLTGSAYGDVSFYSRYDRDVIGYVQLRGGISLPTARVLPMQILAAVNLVKDSNGTFYNNVVEVGPELRFAPFRQLAGLQFEAQYLRGFYAVHDRANPYGPRYGDFRLFLIWSKYF
jgi:tetratricopeptide (TPR) repeat protein